MARVLVKLFGFMLPKILFTCMRPGYDPAQIRTSAAHPGLPGRGVGALRGHRKHLGPNHLVDGRGSVFQTLNQPVG